MSDVLATIRAFVAGEIEPAWFRDRLYSDSEFESCLSNDPHLKKLENYVGNSVYLFLLNLDFDDPGDILNAQGALASFMDRNGIPYTKTSKYGDFYDLVLSALPGWLAVDVKYVQDHLIPLAEGRSGTELKHWLKKEFLKRFKYHSSPPEWIQSPDWPIGENGPFVFLGQLPLESYFHDTAAVYIFHDPKSGEVKTVIQVY